DCPKVPLLSPVANAGVHAAGTRDGTVHHLVDDLLLLTRLETRPRRGHEEVDVPALLRNICDECNALSENGPRVELILESQVGLLGDTHELHSAFTNIIVNALKYSPEESKVRVIWRERAGAIRLDVEDQGDGIFPEHIPRITERFYRVDSNRSRKQGGTGLGLAIVKHVLTRHGGVLKIASEPGKGSCFSCCFPAELAKDSASRFDMKQVGSI
ncbi:MAG: ATP-binding protein, partial [Pseudomonadota bacterium]